MAEHNADMTPRLLEDPDEKKQKMEHGHGHSHDHDDGHAPAKIVALGTVTLGGATFMIDRDGQVEAGVETEFGVELVGAAAMGTGLYEHGHGHSTGVAAMPSAAWLANPDGEKLCEPESGEGHDQHWHFKVTSRPSWLMPCLALLALYASHARLICTSR